MKYRTSKISCFYMLGYRSPRIWKHWKRSSSLSYPTYVIVLLKRRMPLIQRS